jgi:hypothetical protein
VSSNIPKLTHTFLFFWKKKAEASCGCPPFALSPLRKTTQKQKGHSDTCISVVTWITSHFVSRIYQTTTRVALTVLANTRFSFWALPTSLAVTALEEGAFGAASTQLNK